MQDCGPHTRLCRVLHLLMIDKGALYGPPFCSHYSWRKFANLCLRRACTNQVALFRFLLTAIICWPAGELSSSLLSPQHLSRYRPHCIRASLTEQFALCCKSSSIDEHCARMQSRADLQRICSLDAASAFWHALRAGCPCRGRHVLLLQG